VTRRPLKAYGQTEPATRDVRTTPPDVLAECARLAIRKRGAVFHLDVAAQNWNACAERWYGPGSPYGEDGLREPWKARYVWCNPPYSQIPRWAEKAASETAAGNHEVAALLLPANRTEQPWWQERVEPFRDRGLSPTVSTYFLAGRVRFGSRENPEGMGSPPFASVLVVFRT
jgi:phage N-6-adenine-methyltransferase